MACLGLNVVFETPFGRYPKRPFDQRTIHKGHLDRRRVAADSKGVERNGTPAPVMKGKAGNWIGLVPMKVELFLNQIEYVFLT